MASLMYNNAKAQFAGAGIDWANASVKALLVSTGYSPAASDQFVSAVTNELSGGNYSRQNVTGRSVSVDNVGNRAKLLASNTTWASLASAQVAAAVVLFKQVNNDSDSILIAYVDIADVTPNGGDITVQWNANGVLTLS